SLPGVAEAAVLAVADGTGSQELMAFVAGAGLSPRALQESLGERLPAPMIPSRFVMLDALPLTPNGKVDRRALVARWEQGDRSAESGEGGVPRTPAEEMLAGIWSQLLGVETVGRDDHFFALGGHSLVATRLAARVREAFGVELPLAAVLEHPRLAAMAAVVERRVALAEQAAPSPQPPSPPDPLSRAFPLPSAPNGRGGIRAVLSFAQERLWFFDRFEPGRATYNIPVGVRLEGDLDFGALAAALSALVARHEVLRTVFPVADGQPYQKVLPAAPVALPLIDLAGLPDAESEALWLAREEARRPFDLENGPLLRANLIQLGELEHWLLLNQHHIVSDGASLEILAREISTFNSAPALPPPPIQYADFAVWQRQQLTGPVLEHQLAWWRERLAGAPAALELLTDRPRPAVQSGRGGMVPVVLPPEVADGVAGF